MTSEFWSPFDRAQPQYARLGREIAEEINRGAFTVGSLLPTEAQLCQSYGVSRHTVRAALKELQSIGLVASHQGVGTRVIAAEPVTIFQATWRSLSEVGDGSNFITYKFAEKGLRITDSQLAKSLGCTSGRALAFVKLIAIAKRAKNQNVIGLTEVFIDTAFSGIIERDHHSELDIITELENESGEPIRRIDLSFQSEQVIADHVNFLGCNDNDIFTSIRKTYSSATMEHIALSKSIWKPGEFDLSFSFERKI